MMYTLDLSGHADDGTPGVDRFGGRFLSEKDAESHGRAAATSRRLVFRPTSLWIRDEENNVVRRISLGLRHQEHFMQYEVTITTTDGDRRTFACGGASDQEAMIYAGKVVEVNADASKPDAFVDITKDGKKIGPIVTVRDMITKAI